MLVDGGLFGVALYLAHWFRSTWPLEIFGGTREIYPLQQYQWLFVLLPFAGPLVLRAQGFYSRSIMGSRRLTAWILLQSCFWVTCGTVVTLFLFRSQLIARSVVFYIGIFSFVLIWAKEEILRSWRQTNLGISQLQKKLILVGSPEETSRLGTEFAGGEALAYKVAAVIDINESPVEKLVQLLHETSANGVVLVAQHTYFGMIEETIEVCEREGVEVWLLADFFKTRISNTTVDDLFGRPTLVFRTAPQTSWQGFAKNILDFVGAAFLLLAGSIPMLVVALLVKLTSPGPILFRQKRSGLNGEPFTMLKFRSMTTDAEQRKHELAAFNEMSGPVFKIANDPRVTKVGKFLRRTSLDELPQLFNVLRGEMSLVGPRPLPVDEVRRFDDLAHRRRLSVKPGLTCLWQISGRSEVKNFNDWVRLDLEYIDNWSIWLDIKIIIRTIPVVLRGTGAR